MEHQVVGRLRTRHCAQVLIRRHLEHTATERGASAVGVVATEHQLARAHLGQST